MVEGAEGAGGVVETGGGTPAGLASGSPLDDEHAASTKRARTTEVRVIPKVLIPAAEKVTVTQA